MSMVVEPVAAPGNSLGEALAALDEALDALMAAAGGDLSAGHANEP